MRAGSDEGIPFLRFDATAGEDVHLGHSGCSTGQLEHLLKSLVRHAHGAVQLDDAHARTDRFENGTEGNG
jgi:hypothetical protein